MKKVRTKGILIYKCEKMKCFLTEEMLDDVAYFLQNSANKSLTRLRQQAEFQRQLRGEQRSLKHFEHRV